MCEDLRFHPHKIAFYSRRLPLEPRDIPVIVDSIGECLMGDPEMRPDELRFHLRQNALVKKRHLEEEVIIKGFLVYTQFGCAQADRREATAFSVPSVVHLYGRFEYVTAAHRDAAGETGYAAAALFSFCARLLDQSFSFAAMIS